jgi:hypothetical protein
MIWFRRSILTRLAAAAWWLFMAAFAVGLLVPWINFVAQPSLPRLIVAVVVTPLVGLALAREAPNAQRMGRMLVTGT